MIGKLPILISACPTFPARVRQLHQLRGTKRLFVELDGAGRILDGQVQRRGMVTVGDRFACHVHVSAVVMLSCRLTLRLSRCRKRERGTSGRWRQSAAGGCSAGLRLRTPPQAPVHSHAVSHTPAPRLASGPLQPDSHSRPAEILRGSRSRVTGRGGGKNTPCAPALLAMLGRCASCLHLHNAPTRLVTCDLPVRDELLKRFQDKQRWAYPKHTGAIGLLRT